MDAERTLLVQDLALTWRYSIGNPYEEFSFPEGVDVAQVMGEHGFEDVAQAILRTSLTRRPKPYPNWKMGEKLLGSALHYRLFARPRLRRPRDARRCAATSHALGRQIDASPTGLLGRERYSSDIPDSVYGLHSQAVAWQGLRRDGRGLGADGPARRSRAAAGAGRSARRGACAGPCASRSAACPTARSSSRCACSTTSSPYGSVTESRARQLLEPRRPLRPRVGPLRPGRAEATRRPSLPAAARLSPARARPRRRLRALRPDAPFPTSGTDEVYGSTSRASSPTTDQRRPARAQPLRTARGGDDARHVRLGRGRERRSAPRRAPPRDVPAAERRRRTPPSSRRSACCSCHETDPTRPRARLRDAAGLARARPADRRPGRAHELRSRLVLDRGGRTLGRAYRRRAARARARAALASAPAPAVRQRIAGVVLNGAPVRSLRRPHAETIDLSGGSGALDLVVGPTGGTSDFAPACEPAATCAACARRSRARRAWRRARLRVEPGGSRVVRGHGGTGRGRSTTGPTTAQRRAAFVVLPALVRTEEAPAPSRS